MFGGSGGTPLKTLAMLGGVIGMCAALSGCADPANSPFPSLARINPMGNVLSKEEQAKALKELEQEQKEQAREAPEEAARQ